MPEVRTVSNVVRPHLNWPCQRHLTGHPLLSSKTSFSVEPFNDSKLMIALHSIDSIRLPCIRIARVNDN